MSEQNVRGVDLPQTEQSKSAHLRDVARLRAIEQAAREVTRNYDLGRPDGVMRNGNLMDALRTAIGDKRE